MFISSGPLLHVQIFFIAMHFVTLCLFQASKFGILYFVPLFLLRLFCGATQPLSHQSTGGLHLHLGCCVLPEFPSLLRPVYRLEALLQRLQRQPGGGAQRILGQAPGKALHPGKQAKLHRYSQCKLSPAINKSCMHLDTTSVVVHVT